MRYGFLVRYRRTVRRLRNTRNDRTRVRHVVTTTSVWLSNGTARNRPSACEHFRLFLAAVVTTSRLINEARTRFRGQSLGDPQTHMTPSTGRSYGQPGG